MVREIVVGKLILPIFYLVGIYSSSVSASCFRCILGAEETAYCVDGFVFGGSGCTAIGNWCVTPGSCFISPGFPSPPLDPSDTNPDSKDCTGVSDISSNKVLLDNSTHDLISDQSELVYEILSGFRKIHQAENGFYVPVTSITDGLVKIQDLGFIEFSGEIYQAADNRLSMYFEFYNHPEYKSVEVSFYANSENKNSDVVIKVMTGTGISK